MDRFQRAKEQVGVNIGSKNNLDMNFVLQDDFWLLHPTSFVLVHPSPPPFFFCTITNLILISWGWKTGFHIVIGTMIQASPGIELIHTTASIIMHTSVDGDTQAQKGWVSCPKLHSRPVMDSGFNAQAAWHQNQISEGQLIMVIKPSSDWDSSLGILGHMFKLTKALVLLENFLFVFTLYSLMHMVQPF